ncbi:unnamed protein product [Sphenostylis stenocarpa]|uniref:Uncharacterized protein n=1 Tax=Sphenostylis stenocarpa TaxID=92480 RepID=A0AA86RY16_9FABA|nr:unnamed protein product [Sphenostylis stenocarpa]
MHLDSIKLCREVSFTRKVTREVAPVKDLEKQFLSCIKVEAFSCELRPHAVGPTQVSFRTNHRGSEWALPTVHPIVSSSLSGGVQWTQCSYFPRDR